MSSFAALLLRGRPGLKEIRMWTHRALRPGLVRSFASESRCSCNSLSGLQRKCAFQTQILNRFFSHGRGRLDNVIVRFSGRYSKSEVTRDILLYKNSKNRFFLALGFFACAQLVFWTYLTHTAFLSMRDTNAYVKVKYGPEGAPDDVVNWSTWSGARMKLSSGIWRYAITLLCIGAGSIIFIGSFTYSRKSIHRIILRKGGENLTLETFGFFGRRWSFTAPLGHVSCEHSRHGVRTQLPIKVKGHRFFYILDKDGKFYNARLFDYTAGMHRMLL